MKKLGGNEAGTCEGPQCCEKRFKLSPQETGKDWGGEKERPLGYKGDKNQKDLININLRILRTKHKVKNYFLFHVQKSILKVKYYLLIYQD